MKIAKRHFYPKTNTANRLYLQLKKFKTLSNNHHKVQLQSINKLKYKYKQVYEKQLTHIIEHKIKSFSRLFLTLYALLVIDFSNETYITPPTSQR